MASSKIKSHKEESPKAVKVADTSVKGGTSLRLNLSLFLIALSFIVYANSFHNGFTVDDNVMVVNNRYVTQGISAIPTLLATPHQKGFWDLSNDEYRPLSLVVFAAVVQFFSVNSTPLHVLNVLLFAGCVVLLFRFLCSIVGEARMHIAFIASLLFALHPIHTEVVANIKSMDELLCFFLAFLGLNVFVKYSESGRRKFLVLGMLCIFLASLSKETVVTFLGIVPLIFFFHKNEDKRRSVHVVLVTISAIAFFLLLRFAVLSYYHANGPTPISIIGNALTRPGLSVESKLATAVLILGYYVKLLFVPYPLSCDYSFRTIPYTHFSDPLVLLSVAFYIGIAVLGIRLFTRDRKSLYAFGIFWFLMTIALFANIFVLIKSTMGERFLFFPSVGFCLVAALLIGRLGDRALTGARFLRQPTVLAVISVVCLVYSFMIINRNEDWKDDNTLYTADLKKHPDNARLNYMVGYQFFSQYKQTQNPFERSKALDEAISYMNKSVQILPEHYFALTDLGAAYFERGQLDSAEIFDKAALDELPGAEVSRNNLSGVYIQEKKYDKDIHFCEETITTTKHNGNGYADLGLCFLHLGQYDSAVYYLRQGISNVPEFYGCYDLLGYLYYTTGKTDSAKKYKDIANRLKGQ